MPMQRFALTPSAPASPTLNVGFRELTEVTKVVVRLAALTSFGPGDTTEMETLAGA